MTFLGLQNPLGHNIKDHEKVSHTIPRKTSVSKSEGSKVHQENIQNKEFYVTNLHFRFCPKNSVFTFLFDHFKNKPNFNKSLIGYFDFGHLLKLIFFMVRVG